MMKKVAWLEGNTVTVCDVPEVDIYGIEGTPRNEHGVEIVAPDGYATDFYIVDVIEAIYFDWTTVDYCVIVTSLI